MNYQERLFKALKSECEANINEALLTLDLCFHNGVAIGEHVLDLKAVVDLGFLNISPEVVAQPSLNAFIALGKQTTKTVRQVLQQWLQQEDSLLYAHPNLF